MDEKLGRISQRVVMTDSFDDPAIPKHAQDDFTLAAYNAGPARIAGLRRRAEQQGLDPNRWFYLAGGIVVVAPIAGLLIKISKSLPATEVTVFEDGFGSVKEVGQLLFTQWLLPFEIVSILLLVALVGAVVLAGKRGVN